MRARYILMATVASALVMALLVSHVYLGNPAEEDYSEVFIGVDAAYDSPEEIKTLVDAISPYTNVFVIGSTGITYNETKLTDLCQYIYGKGLSFIIYTDYHYSPGRPSKEWIENAKEKWGDSFLGLYVYDEVGGKHLDLWTWRIFTEADNNTDARTQFVSHLESLIRTASSNTTDREDIQAFSSDYALYWYDYKAGYDVLFAEFGWNYSRQLNVAMCRGAAVAHDRDWGAMITWTYNQSPYLGSREELYNDIVLAYKNGAKYILVFDTNENYTHGILTEEHLQAIKDFTQYAHSNPRKNSTVNERTAFVLPKDYGYGFRGPEDRIWGVFPSDATSYALSVKLGDMLETYGDKLDVIYDEVDYSALEYRQIVFWNGTILNR